MALRARSKAVEESLLAQAAEALRRGTYGPAGAAEGRAIMHCPDFPAYWVDIDGERVVGDSMPDIQARARAYLRRREIAMGDAEMQMSKKRGLTLLQYRADTDKRIQALEDGVKGLAGALDDVRAEVASAQSEASEKIGSLENSLENCLNTAFSKIATLEDEEKSNRRHIERRREEIESAEQTASDRLLELEARVASLEKLDREREAKYEAAKATVSELCDLVDTMRLELDLATRPWWRKIAERIFGAE